MQITVVGGAYREYCVEPAIDRLVGSGLRAAGLLASLGDDVSFHTAIDDASLPEFNAVCASLRVTPAAVRRTGPVAFTYETPVHSTTRHGQASADPLHVDGDYMLMFGMVETACTVHAQTLVIDPQHSPVDDVLGSAAASRLTLILNEHEARRATGNDDVEQAAMELLGSEAEAVVVKRGALGALVAHRDTINHVGAIPTDRVQPLGSGDAFSAGYSHSWFGGADPIAAAQFGSRVAAAHSLIGTPCLQPGCLDALASPLPYPQDASPRVYLAGPFFTVAQRQLIRTLRRTLIHLGAEVFSPLDEIGHGGDEVAEQDLKGLRGCHSVLAVLDGGDPGTLFEVGWATHAGIPVVGFAEHPDDHMWTMARGTGTPITRDLSSAVYRAVWLATSNIAS